MTGLLNGYDKQLTKCQTYSKCKIIFEEKMELIKGIEILSAHLKNLLKLLTQIKHPSRSGMRLDFGKSYMMLGQSSPKIRI